MGRESNAGQGDIEGDEATGGIRGVFVPSLQREARCSRAGRTLVDEAATDRGKLMGWRATSITAAMVCALGCVYVPARASTDASPVGVLDSGMDASIDTWIPDLGAWLFVDAERVDLPPRQDRPFATYDVPRCETFTVEECPCAGGARGLQVCNNLGIYSECHCVPPPPAAGALPPRLLKPFSGLRSMTRRPTFRWVLPEGMTRARVELCDDRPCTRRITQAEVTGTSWRPTELIRPGVVFWRVAALRDDGTVGWTSATWEVGIRHRDTPVDSAWGPIKDFNGDTLDDLVAFAYPLIDEAVGSLDQTQGIYVLPGNRETLIGEGATIRSPMDFALLGRRSALGDLNGDGRTDLALNSETPSPGSVSVYHGQSDGLVSERATLLTMPDDPTGPSRFFGNAIAIEDFNGDGYGDLCVFGRSPLMIYPGSPAGIRRDLVRETGRSGLNVDIDQFVQAAGLGDLDGDGFGDVAVVRGDRIATVIYGNPACDPGLRVVNSEFANRYFTRQTSLFTTDINSDGAPDVVMGDPRMVARNYRGALIQVQIRPIQPFILDYEVWIPYRRNRISRPADFNADGRPDLAEGELCDGAIDRTHCAQTQVRLYPGHDGYIPMEPAWSVDVSTSTFAGSPGDLDGDGFDDLVVADGTSLTVFLGRAGVPERQTRVFTTESPIQHNEQQPLL